MIKICVYKITNVQKNVNLTKMAWLDLKNEIYMHKSQFLLKMV